MVASAGDGSRAGRRILVVANETVAGRALRDEIRRHVEGYEDEVFVVCPALNSRIRHWLSDVDRARTRAQQRLDDSLRALSEIGILADGSVGEDDPLQAINDALRTFPADEIIISTHPPGRSNWLEKRVVARARAHCRVPIWHVIVDLEQERASAVPEIVEELPAAPHQLDAT